MSRVFLSLGSNKGEREEYLKNALVALECNPKVNIIAVSSVYETKPYGDIPQKNYFNGVVLIETEYSPDEIYFLIKKIEKEVGRTASVKWGEREIDIDIILIDSLIFENKNITIPHKEYDLRDFVLVPICEIDSHVTDPKTGIKLEDIIKSLNKKYIIDKVNFTLN
ncbi:MAG: 2-amino-4-hydroxy-6-hydroxymethyldihydropteridine diphosphokinase [Melioribacteraceae bacterium]|nr:2-amino-4-hydroxy-6-hydroxymethyldihydropteridine diphosphokinase [Melioribacteraceae bacterium]